MSIDNVNNEDKAKKDIGWKDLIKGSESEIEHCQERIKRLRKSLIFFKKQDEMGIPFPVTSGTRHQKIS